MNFTCRGIAVIEGDNYLSKDIDIAGRLDVARDLLLTFRQHIPDGGIVCDVGASLGDYAATFSEFVGRTGIVYAFEPNPPAFECLRYNMAFYPNVMIYGSALGAVEGHGTMVPDRNNAGASRITIDGGPIPITTIDHVAEDWFRLDFLKIDAEGFEPLILDGAKETIRNFRPAMLIEINQWMLGKLGFDMTDIYNRLKELGYVFPVSDGHFADILCIPKERQ